MRFTPNYVSAILLSTVLAYSFAQKANGQWEDYPPTFCNEKEFTKSVSGRVADRDGTPVARANVLPSRYEVYNPNNVWGNFSRPEQTSTKTGLGGKFSIDKVDQRTTHMLITARGYAPHAAPISDDGKVDATLETGREISGTILGPDGNPIANATVQMTHWLIPREKLLETRFSQHGYNQFHSAALPNNGASSAVRTDSDGQFEIRDLPHHRVALVVKAHGILEELIYVRGIQNGEDDSRGTDFEGQILVSNNFQQKAKACSTLTVNAFDADGLPASVGRVILQPFSAAQNADILRREVTLDKNNSINLPNYTDGFCVYVFPQDSSKLMGKRIEFPAIVKSKRQELIQEVYFQSGLTIRGIVVDQSTELGIEGVPLRWRSHKEGETDSDGNLVAWNIKTDEAGMFEAAIPNSSGTFGVAGKVPGYRSVFNWIARRYYGWKDRKVECISRYARELDEKEIESLPPLRFELQPSFNLNVSVQLENGTAVENAKVTAPDLAKQAFNYGSQIEERIKKTNELGQCQFEHWYYDEIELELASKRKKDGSQPTSPNHSYPLVLRAVSPGGLHGIAAVSIPDLEDSQREINATIKLSEPGNVKGQIVNVDGSPVPGLQVSVTNTSRFSRSGYMWTTQTRDDGRFLMADLPVGVELTWSVDEKMVKTGKQGHVELDSSGMRSNFTLEADPITVLNLQHLSEPFPEVSIASVDNDEALGSLREFALSQLNKIPGNPGTAEQKFMMYRSSDDQISKFDMRLGEKLIPLIQDLADRDQGGEFELKVLSEASSWYMQDPRYSSLMNNADTLLFCHQRLLGNQVENEIAQKAIIEVSRYMSRSGNFAIWQQVLEKSPFQRTKATAKCFLAQGDLVFMEQFCMTNVRLEDFQKQFSRFKSRLSSALETDGKLVSKEDIESLKGIVSFQTQNFKEVRRRYEEFVAPPNQIVADLPRVQMVIDLLEKYESPEK